MKKAELLNFLQSQKALAIASCIGDDLWIANVFMGVADNFNIYFISSEDTKHSQQIIINPNVAFSTIWFNPKDHTDRKGVQGKGVCRIATTDNDISQGVMLHNKNYPEFKKRITPQWIKTNEYKSRVWIIKPSFIKFWNDELYGEEETEEFNF